MKPNWLKLSVLPLVFAPFLLATAQDAQQEEPPQAQKGLRRIEPEEQRARNVFDAERWRTKLTDADLDARERAYDALAKLARRDARARQAIDEWTRSDDGDLAWTARLLRRELDQRNVFRFQNFPQALHVGPQGGVSVDFDDLEQRLREFDRMFGDMGAGLDEMFERFGIDPSAGGARIDVQNQGYSLKAGPDGVVLEITEEKDGKKETQRYEAESLEALLEAHPELKDKVSIGAPGNPRMRALRDLFPERRRAVPPFPTVPTDILGIEYTRVTDEQREDLGLQPGVGLHVERTVPGTIAHILGIQRGDVLIDLNGTSLVDGEDVSDALARREPQEAIRVTLIDGSRQKRTLTWSPSDER